MNDRQGFPIGTRGGLEGLIGFSAFESLSKGHRYLISYMYSKDCELIPMKRAEDYQNARILHEVPKVP